MSADWIVDWRCKNFPADVDGVPASAVAGQGWQVPRDFATPIAVIKERELLANLAQMRDYCADHGVVIAPHGKPTMSPELIGRQLEHGAWGMTAATAWQARVMIEFGARRVMIANQCVDPVGLRWVAERLRDDPGTEIYVFVDSIESVEVMRAVLQSVPSAPVLPVLVEVGFGGGRAGARSVADAVKVGLSVAAAPEFELAGVAAYEGVAGGDRAPDVLETVRSLLGDIRETARNLIGAAAFREGPVLLSAGGTAFFDEVVDVLAADRDYYSAPVEVVIRSGCYVTHDHTGYFEISPLDFQPALEVWASVLSTPEPGLAILDVGKRDISTDAFMPVVLARVRDGHRQDLQEVTFDHCNDQHGYLHSADPATFRVGDLVVLGISHPCTTFDKWRAIPIVDDQYKVVSVARTFF